MTDLVRRFVKIAHGWLGVLVPLFCVFYPFTLEPNFIVRWRTTFAILGFCVIWVLIWFYTGERLYPKERETA